MASFTTTPPAPPTSADAAAREMLRILPLLHHTVSALSLLSYEVRDLRPALQDHQDATVAELCQRLTLIIKRMTPPPPAGPAGGSGPLNWTLSQETKDQIAEIDRATIAAPWNPGYTSFDGTYHGPSPILAGAAGGGSGDLGALSAGAIRKLVENAFFEGFEEGGEDATDSLQHHPGGRGLRGPGDPEKIWQQSETYKAISAPTPDLGALSAACKPWEFCAGDPPDYDSPLHQVFVAGMLYTEKLLAGFLDVDIYEPGDGSEDFDQDATKSLENILTAAGLYDPEEGRKATLAPTPDLGALGEPVAWLWERCVREYPGEGIWETTATAVRPVANVCCRNVRPLYEHPPGAAEPAAGWRLVPEECTPGMMRAFWLAGPYPEKPFAPGYRAMIAAAPTPPSGVETIRQAPPEGLSDPA